MKRIRVIILVLVALLIINVKADDYCDKEELARLKELAKKVEFDYEYKLVNNRVIFSITAVNLTSELKAVIIENYYTENYKEFVNDGKGKGTLDNFNQGEKVIVTLKGFVSNWCSGKTVLTKTVKLPYYNYYYDEEKCRGNEDFKYCKQLIDSNITKEAFDNQFELYLKSKEVKTEVEEKIDNNKLIYIIIGSISGVVAIGAVIMIIVNNKRKNEL